MSKQKKTSGGLADLAALTGLGNPDARPQSNSAVGSVYSTEHGRTCEGCGRAKDDCQCQTDTVPEGDGIVRISRSTKGRGGKVVTLVSGVLLPADELKVLAKALKKHCGVGGVVKDGVIEIQGEQRDALVAELTKRGFQAKKSGG